MRPHLARRASAFFDLVFPALTITAGLQMLRVFIPAIVLHKRAGYSLVEFGAMLFGPFLLAFFAPALRRWLGARRALIAAAASVSLVRLLLQLIRVVDARLWLSALGVLSFLVFVPIYLGCARGSKQIPNFGLAFLIGIAFDTTLHGLFATYDYVWVIDTSTVALAATLTIAQLLLLWRFGRSVQPALNSDTRLASALPLAAFGPMLFLHVVYGQNIARVAAESGAAIPAAYLFVMLGNAAGIAFGAVMWSVRSKKRWAELVLSLALIAGATLLTVVVTGTSRPQFAFMVGLMTGPLLRGYTDVVDWGEDRRGLWRISTAWAMGMLGFLLLLIAYYIGYDTKLPFDNTLVALLAVILSALVSLPLWRKPDRLERPSVTWTPIAVGVALLVFPIAQGAAWVEPGPTQTGDYPVRVMSYNIHMGFDAEGWLDLEAIAQTIESSGASIVALQEVPRGWYINASVDALNWLARRLNMTYVFGEAADPVWGNAILSRYPIIQSGNTPLPEGGVRPRRSVLWADIDLTDPDDMIVIATHLHHADARPRLLQIPVVLDEYAVRPQRRLIIMGDMNATPDSTEVALFRQAGLRDAFDLAGSGDGFTYRADRPFERIDYIWLSPNLRAADFSVIDSTASDHLGIAVTINP